MVECARLETECGSDVTVGSNPTLSVFEQMPDFWAIATSVRHTRFQLTAVKAESRSLKLPSTQITPIAGTILGFPGSPTNADDFPCLPTGSLGVLLSCFRGTLGTASK